MNASGVARGAERRWPPTRSRRPDARPLRIAARALRAVLCALLLLAGPAAAEGRALPEWLRGRLHLGVGVDYSSGDYGLPETSELTFVTLFARYEFEELALTPGLDDQVEIGVTVPYLWSEGSAAVGDGVFTTRAAGSQVERGPGDVVVRGSYILYPDPGSRAPALELRAGLELPTADEEKLLGTGTTDVTIEAEVFRTFGRFTPFLSGGWRFTGSSDRFALRDAPLAAAGVVFSPGGSWSAGLAYDWAAATSVGARDRHEIFGFGSLRVRRDLYLTPYAVAGLSDGSPDFALGLQLRLVVPVE